MISSPLFFSISIMSSMYRGTFSRRWKAATTFHRCSGTSS